MKEYHKINTLYKRGEKGKIIESEFSCPEFEFLFMNNWIFTEKVDGTNIRILWDGSELRYGGKTDNAQIPVFLYDYLNKLFKGQESQFQAKFGSIPVCLYGEGYGNKIQASGKDYNPSGVGFVLFDVFVSPSFWLERVNIEKFSKSFSLRTVPIVGEGSLQKMVDMCQKGFKSQWGNFNAEGIVARPEIELFNHKGERIIVKLKTRDFN
jgi:hypothetical protein